jgi:hypothetical protein
MRIVLALSALLGLRCASPSPPQAPTTPPDGTHPAAGLTALSSDIDARVARIAAIGRGEGGASPGVEHELDEQWAAFRAAGEEGQARVRAAITREIAAGGRRSDFVLLELGHFLAIVGGAENAKSAEGALVAIDPGAPSIRRSWTDFFRFTHRVARERPQIRPVIDRAFLGKDYAVVLPGDHLPLASHIVTTYLYGVTGPDAEDHLASLLALPGTPHREVLEAMAWLGTERTVDAVARAIRADPSEETVKLAVTMLMQVGGRRGRDAVLAIDVRSTSTGARAYLDRIRPSVAATTGEELKAQFASFHGPDRLQADELRRRLDQMVARDGRDDELSPMALLNSDLTTNELVARLAAIRTAQLRSLSHGAIEDVETTNALIEAIEWR